MPDEDGTVSSPVARVQMLIRRPASAIFAALVDPQTMARFWFSRGSGPLEMGSRVRWEWEMYGVGADVEVREIEPDRRLLYAWGEPGNSTPVEWTLEPRGAGATFVVVRNWGFHGNAEKVVAAALEATGGWSFVVAALKAWLEQGVVLDLVLDHAPDHLVPDWASGSTGRSTPG